MGKYLFFAANLIFSIYLYGNIMEVVLSKDLPIFPSFVSADIGNSIDMTRDKITTPNGYYGEPTNLKFPKLGTNLVVKYKQPNPNGKTQVSIHDAYFYTYTPSKYGLLGNTVFYSSDDYLPIREVSLLVEGDRIILTTNTNWVYTYRVVEKRVLTKGEDSFLNDKVSPSNLVIFSEVRDNTVIRILAEYENVSKERI